MFPPQILLSANTPSTLLLENHNHNFTSLNIHVFSPTASPCSKVSSDTLIKLIEILMQLLPRVSQEWLPWLWKTLRLPPRRWQLKLLLKWFISVSFKFFSPQNRWFCRVYFRFIQVRDSAYWKWKYSRYPINLANFHAVWNRCKYIIWPVNLTLTKRKHVDLLGSPANKSF